jgi:uncharacterized RmlC-like cupin family protein
MEKARLERPAATRHGVPGAGDAIYIPVRAWHQHTNASESEPCRYVACESAALMQNLGAAAREEGRRRSVQ